MAKKNRHKYQKWFYRYCDKLLLLILLGIIILFIPGQNIYTREWISETLPQALITIDIPSPAKYPVAKTTITPGSEFTATGIIIRDLDSRVYLYKRNEDELLAPASTTKIMTALVALDSYNLDDIVTVKTVISEGQVMGLIPGERITVENLLYGALIHSGNDAAYALAEHYPGGVDKFVEAMNQKAKQLHLDHSSFTNPVGFDDPNHKMTPLDLEMLAAAGLNNKIFTKIVAIPAITISDVTHTYFHQLKNVNTLLGKIPGVGGIKTGYTEEAGESLVTLVERDGHKVIIVLLRSQDRFGETTKLITWVFSNFEWLEFAPIPSMAGQ